MFGTSFVISILVAVSVFLLLVGLRLGQSEEPPAERLKRLSQAEDPLTEVELTKPFYQRVLKPFLTRYLQALGRLAPKRNIDSLRHALATAGHPFDLGAMDFLGLKVLLTVSVGSLAMFILFVRQRLSFAPIGALLAAMVAFLLPDLWLRLRIRSRKAEIRRSLPDALDMLTICVDAGEGFDSALRKISQKWNNALAMEFGRIVAEIGVGRTRREAFRNMARRVDVEEVSSFVAVLLQADQLGLSVSRVLHAQSEQLRVRRWQQAEEHARRIPILLLFPLIFMIFPAVLAVTIGPAIPAIVEAFAELAH
ncbi:MAG: type II secretion system F family protein [Chloroflexi bacterium]|nr:type II secretion system F family protein [Chloroflexota bacterium]